MTSLSKEKSSSSLVGGEAVDGSNDTVIADPFGPGHEEFSPPVTPTFNRYGERSRGSSNRNTLASTNRMKQSNGSSVLTGEAAAAAAAGGQGLSIAPDASTAGLGKSKGSPLVASPSSLSSSPKKKAEKSHRRKKKSATAGHSSSLEPSPKGVVASKDGKAPPADCNGPLATSVQSLPPAVPVSGHEDKEEAGTTNELVSDGEEELCGICLEKPPLEGFVRLWCCNNVLCVKDAQHIGRCPFCRTEPLVWDIEK